MDSTKMNVGQLSEKEAVSLLDAFTGTTGSEGDKEKLIWLLRAGCAATGLKGNPDQQPQELSSTDSEDEPTTGSSHETVTVTRNKPQLEELSASADVCGNDELSDANSSHGTPKGTDPAKSPSPPPQAGSSKAPESSMVDSFFSKKRSPTKRRLYVGV